MLDTEILTQTENGTPLEMSMNIKMTRTKNGTRMHSRNLNQSVDHRLYNIILGDVRMQCLAQEL